MRRLNVKLLVILLVSTAVVSVSVYFVHGWQLDNNIDTLFHQAKQAEEDKDFRLALKLYRRYLANAPKDSVFEKEARCNQAIVADRMAQGSNGGIWAMRNAYSLLKDANVADPTNAEVKRRVINYYLIDRGTPNAFKIADELIRELLEESPDDVDLHLKLAVSQQGRARYREAISTLSKVVGYDPDKGQFQTSSALDPTSLGAYLQLAQLLSKELDRTDAARQVIDKLVRINGGEFKAYEYRARYWRWRIQEDTAEESHDSIRKRVNEDLAKARKLGPESGEVLLASADFATEQEKHAEAEKFLQEAVDKYEDKFTIYAKLAESLLRQGKRDAALAEIKKGSEQLPNHIVLLRVQADLQLDDGAVEDAEATIENLAEVLEKYQLRKRDDAFSRYYLKYLQARMSFAKGEWVDAQRQFERVRPLMSTRKDVVRRVDHFLSVCYQKLGRTDEIKSDTVQGLLRDVNQAASLGDVEGAIKQMQVLGAKIGRKKFLSVPLLRATWLNLHVREATAKPEDDPQRWKAVDDLVARLNEVEGYEGVEKIVGEAEILYLKGEKAAAGRMLRDAVIGDHKKEMRVWLAWINMYQRERSPAEAIAQVDRATKQLGDVVALRLLRAGLLVAEAEGNATAKVVDEIEALGRDTKKFSETDQFRLMRGLAGAYLRLGDSDRAKAIYQQLAESKKSDPTIHTQLFNLALATQDDETMDSAIKQIAKLLGGQSAQHKYLEASKIVSRVNRKKDEKEELTKAEELIASAKKKRPNWHELPRLQGDIYLAKGRLAQATESYEEAVSLGSRNVMVIRRLAQLLHRAGRHDDALQKLALLGKRQKAGLTRIEAESTSITGNTQQALALAKKAVEEDKGKEKKWNDHLWYGQLLQRAGKTKEAGEQFQQAVKIGPEIPNVWVTLVSYLVENDKKAEALEATRKAEAALSEDTAPYVLAQCYELLKDNAKAEKYYRQVQRINPDSTGVNRVLATFYLRTNRVADAQEYLATLLDKASKDDDPNVFWARRVLAELKARSGTYRDTVAALELLEANELDGKQQREDRILTARLLARRPERVSRLKAIDLFEDLRSAKQIGPADIFTLAKLHLLIGDFDAFSKVMQTLPLDDNQAFLSTYIDAFIEEERVKQAAPLLRKLESLDADAPVAIALRARMLHEYDKTDEAVKLLKTLVPRSLAVKELGRIPQVAKLMEDFGRPDAAEVLYKRFEREHPAGVLAYAGFLGRQGDLDGAFRLLSTTTKKLAFPAVIQTGLGILHQSDRDIESKYFQALESWLAQGEKKQPGSLRLAVLRPQLRSLQGRYDETMELYGELLKRKDLPLRERSMFLNNLAFMNAIRGRNLAESRKMIDEAIDILGPNSDLLDTRAVALIGHDNDQALKDLNEAIAESPDAIKYFHRALVRLEAQDKKRARADFAQANDKGFDIDTLDPAERGQYQRLVKALKQ